MSKVWVQNKLLSTINTVKWKDKMNFYTTIQFSFKLLKKEYYNYF